MNFQETVCIERLAYDQSGAAVEFSRSWIDTNIARYTTRIVRTVMKKGMEL